MPDGFRQIWSRKPFNILKGPRMSDDPAQGAKGQGTPPKGPGGKALMWVVLLCAALH
jgi:hypothetical protein